MRFVLYGLLLFARIGFAAPLGEEGARHLLNRSGFGASPQEVTMFARLERAMAVDQLLAQAQSVAMTPPPGWVNEPLSRRGEAMTEEEKVMRLEEQKQRGFELRGWWLAEMASTASPLTERMTLFWHNHFTSSMQKVKHGQLMYRQNLLLRQHALGSFSDLLHGAAKDPAMLIYLDGVRNLKGEPNENFSREVMELFTLGEGRYTENDIREAARAFTGWGVDRDSGEFRFRRNQHDDGSKTILGQTGNFDGDDVLDLLLGRPETADFITRKLWREFVSPVTDEREVRRLATVFRSNRYQIKPLLQGLFMSEAFWAGANRGSLVKSPIELTVGTLRTFELRPPDWRPVIQVNRAMGQDLFNPPNVKGWPGGDAWINSQTLLLRKQTLLRPFVGPPMRGDAEADSRRFENRRARMELHLSRWLDQLGNDMVRATRLLLPLPADSLPVGTASDRISALLQHPYYQLK